MKPSQAERTRIAHLEREDLLTFLNAAATCTAQRQFYGDAKTQAVSIDFLHRYVQINYRRVYARTLAAGINDFNSAQVIENLLRDPARDPDEARAEGALIAAGLHHLPPQRAYRLLAGLRRLGVCNRRTKRIVRDYLGSRPDPAFHAVKYRRQIKQIVRHFHLSTPGEIGQFLFQAHRSKAYTTPLFDAFRQAHFSNRAIFELPFTIAEGLAARASIPRDQFLARIAPRLTEGERARLQQSGAAIPGIPLEDLGSMSLTRLAIFILSLPLEQRRTRFEELDAALRRAAERTTRRAGFRLPAVAVVLDNSYSTTGSRETHNRPLALALAAAYLLAACAEACSVHWVTPVEAPLLAVPRGNTDLATPLLDALETGAPLVVVLSDGRDNDPPGGAAQVAHGFRTCLDPARKVTMLHLDPTFDASSFGMRGIHRDLPSLGFRDAEDIPMMLTLARFVDGSADLAELEAFLETRAQAFVAAAAAPSRPEKPR